jgi:alpha-1,2-glucosyltransferase
MAQILYFTLFTLIFGSSLWIPHVFDIFRSIRNIKCIAGIFFLSIVIALIIRFNTIIHPYLLADNRHYTFYVFNRLYTRNEYLRYLMIPAYVFGIYTISKSLCGSIGLKIFFVISSLLTFCLQSLIEVRYFLIPFVLLRLLSNSVVEKKWSVVEFLINIIINCLVFRIFFTHEFMWSDFEEPQRIIW